MNGFVYDIEADGLYLQSKKIWYVRLTSLCGSKTLKLYPFKDQSASAKFKEWVHSFEDGCLVIGQNILGFDLWACWKLLGIVPRVGKQGKDWWDGKPVQFVDTFVLSMYLNPDSPKHSLEYLASGSENEKMDFRKALVAAGAMIGNEPKGHEFSFYHPIMDKYCDDDVAANIGVFHKLWKQAQEMYGKDNWIHPSFRQMQKDFWLYSAQAFSGVKFHKERAVALVAHIEEQMAAIKAEVDPILPPRPLKMAEQAFYKIPAKPFTKSGELSANMVKWLEKHNATLVEGVIHAYGLEAPLVANEILPVKMPMEIEDSVELKDWFIANGWVPHEDFWNFKRDPETGKPVRDDKNKFIKTTPKIQNQGSICPNLLKIEGEIPKKVVKFLSYRNRKGVVEGWLNNWRLDFDGRLSAEISGYAPTSRAKHRTVVNCPKADIKVLLGAEMRDLFTVEEGNWYIGVDAAALENRTLSHYCVPMSAQALTRDGWKTYEELSEGEDILAYNPETKTKEWTPLVSKHKFEGAETFVVSSGSFKMRATANHRWFVNYRDTANRCYQQKVVTTEELNTCCNIIVNAPMQEYEGVVDTFAESKYSLSWVERICRKPFREVVGWLEGFLVADGHCNGENAYKECLPKEGGRGWRFTQNEGDHFDAALTAAYLVTDKFVSTSFRNYVRGKHKTATINKRGFVTMQKNASVTRFGVEDVWCPHTAFGSWVMKQGDCISITGNTTRYDNGWFARMNLEGDIHSHNAFAFFPHIAKQFDPTNPENKENPLFKPWRNKAKTGAYLLAFGGGAAKLASSLGLPPKEGKKAYDNYWKANEGLGKLKEAVEKYYSTAGKNKYVPAIDGRLVSVRASNVLISCLGQGCGAIAMSYASCLMDNWLGELHIDDLGRPFYLYKGKKVLRVSEIHDEYSWDVEDGVEDEILEMGERAIIRAGELLKLSIPLGSEGKKAKNGSWKDVH